MSVWIRIDSCESLRSQGDLKLRLPVGIMGFFIHDSVESKSIGLNLDGSGAKDCQNFRMVNEIEGEMQVGGFG